LYDVKQLGIAFFSATDGLQSHSYLTVINGFPLTLKTFIQFTVHIFSRISGKFVLLHHKATDMRQ